jgi:hypothetical protein
MRVIGVTRSGRSSSADVEATVGVERLAEVLPQAQALVITLPSTPATRGCSTPRLSPGFRAARRSLTCQPPDVIAVQRTASG